MSHYTLTIETMSHCEYVHVFVVFFARCGSLLRIKMYILLDFTVSSSPLQYAWKNIGPHGGRSINNVNFHCIRKTITTAGGV